MAKFYVGQRVKLVKPFYQRSMGITGTIEAFDSASAGTMVDDGPLTDNCNCIVHWDGSPADLLNWDHTDNLEPLVPPHEPASWEEVDKLLPFLREKEIA